MKKVEICAKFESQKFVWFEPHTSEFLVCSSILVPKLYQREILIIFILPVNYSQIDMSSGTAINNNIYPVNVYMSCTKTRLEVFATF
jgi:hypothetical protein